MPNRIIREGWLDSEAIDKIGPSGEVFFLRLCLKADDFGRFHAHPRLLATALFPLRNDVQDADCTDKLQLLADAGLIKRYEVGGKRFIEIKNFKQRTRAATSKYPAPEGSGTHKADNGQTDDGQTSDERLTPAHVVGGGGVVGGGIPAAVVSPGWQQAAAWLSDAIKNGADYTESETKSAWLALNANGWRWGKNQVVDWRSALERQIQSDRERKPQQKAKPRGFAP